MATSKTLTPTNVTIQIPAFADKPDQRLNSDCIDKEADAINALSDQIANIDVQLGQVTDLNAVAGSAVATVHHFYFNSSALNNPDTTDGHGYLYTNTGSKTYGSMVVFGYKGIYSRKLNGGTYEAWKTIVTY